MVCVVKDTQLISFTMNPLHTLTLSLMTTSQPAEAAWPTFPEHCATLREAAPAAGIQVVMQAVQAQLKTTEDQCIAIKPDPTRCAGTALTPRDWAADIALEQNALKITPEDVRTWLSEQINTRLSVVTDCKDRLES